MMYKDEYSKINLISNATDLRLYIIENTLHVEEFISWTLGHLLSIEWKISKSLGYGSSALSFNQKVQIIQDIRGLTPDQIKKMSFLMIIRNKFAHIKEVNSFDEFFRIYKEKDIKNKLNYWYSSEIKDNKTDEEKYKFFFFRLIKDICLFLLDITIDNLINKEKEKSTKEVYEKIVENFKKEILKHENGNEIIRKIINLAKEELQKDLPKI